jgi:exopolysaccharide biosynthesis protein
MRKLKICAALLALILMLECSYCVVAFTDWVPPLSDLRDTFIETALGTMEHKWLATALFPADIVAEVQAELEADRLAQAGQNSSPWESAESSNKRDFFALFPEIDPAAFRAFAPVEELEEFYVNRSGLDEVGLDLYTRQGDQVLAIDAANGTLVVRIREEFFRGVLILGKDPSRLSCAAAENWGVAGQRAGQIAQANGALVALTASGFDAAGPEGACQTGAAMCGGTAYGEHLKPGYKRLELRSDDRLYVVDAPADFHPDCTDATEWTPALIVDGEIVVTKEDHYNARNPRCCLGQTKDGTILMLCIEGRYLDSLGATAPECAEILARYEAWQAMNLDGGTSAICWYDGRYITRCSDPELPEGRLLPNCWIYKSVES